MRKILGIFSLVGLMSVSVSSTVSCDWWWAKGKGHEEPPYGNLSDQIPNKELGEIQGDGDIPSLEDIIKASNEVNSKDDDYFHFYTLEDSVIDLYSYLAFEGEPTIEKATVVITNPGQFIVEGSCEFTYHYSKKE